MIFQVKRPSYSELKKSGKMHYKMNKEVFVKQEQAPTAPKLEGVWFSL